jgi:hypothetical protein
MRDAAPPPPVTPAIALFGLFKPLFDRRLFRYVLGRLEKQPTRDATARPLLRIASLLRRGDIDAAISAARSAYHAAGILLADFHTQLAPETNPDLGSRLLASLVFPTRGNDIAAPLSRWFSPTKTNTD